MTDSELNEKVARKLGWERNDNEKAWYSPWHVTEPYIPDYCTDIGAAWEIFQHEPERSGWQGERCLPEVGMIGKRWYAGWGGGSGWNGYAESTTAPRAICEAFLKLEDL